MYWYPILKTVHVTAACLTASLFVLRLGLDASGKPEWRETPLRWLPHLNDTLLLVAAIGLLLVTGWMPFVHHWLTGKVILLVGYIIAGRFAMNFQASLHVRSTATVLALLQLALIFWLALNKPMF